MTYVYGIKLKGLYFVFYFLISLQYKNALFIEFIYEI
jgi:hypothetical protein